MQNPFISYRFARRLLTAALLTGGGLLRAQNTFPSSGFVGIGTTSPSFPLEVFGAGQQELRMTSIGVSGDPASTVRYLRARGTSSSPAPVANGDTIGQLYATPFNGSNYLTACGFAFNVDGPVSSGLMPPGKITFYTTDTTGSPYSRMVINSGGSVGIGTTSPVGALNVVTTSGPSFDDGPNALKLGYAGGNNSGAVGAGLVFSQRYDSSDLSQIRVGGIYGYKQTPSSGFGGGLIFYTQPAGAASFAERMRITCNGYVSIGSSSPDAPLTVKGRIHATEVVVDTAVAAADLKIRPQVWADDVFDERYALAPLSRVEQQIQRDKHLPGIPSAAEVAANGISVGDMQARLLAKIEELTLHQIAQEKEIAALKATIRQLTAPSR